MSTTTCTHCGSKVHWDWEEAFKKFGFNDGDSLIMTETVANALREHGYDVVVTCWGLHNEVITAVRKDGLDLIPKGIKLGYDDPRTYLPIAVVQLLEQAFPEDAEVES